MDIHMYIHICKYIRNSCNLCLTNMVDNIFIIYTHIYVYRRTLTYIYINTHIHINMYIYIYTCVYVNVYPYHLIYIYICQQKSQKYRTLYLLHSLQHGLFQHTSLSISKRRSRWNKCAILHARPLPLQ